MPDDRARGRGIEPDPARPLRGEREDQIRVAPAVGMVVDADAVEAGVLAARDDVRDRGDRPPDGNPEVAPSTVAICPSTGGETSDGTRTIAATWSEPMQALSAEQRTSRE